MKTSFSCWRVSLFLAAPMPQSATIEVREHTGTLWPAVVAAVLSRGWTHPLDTFRVSRAGVPGTLVRSLYAGT